MSSRSRRSLKNTDSHQKILKEDSPRKEEDVIGRRRSLRHSPGSSSLSPPRKVQCMKQSPNTAKQKEKNLPAKSNKILKTQIPSQNNAIKDNKEEDPHVIPTRRAKRGIPITENSTPVKNAKLNSRQKSTSPTEASKNTNGSAVLSTKKKSRTRGVSATEKVTTANAQQPVRSMSESNISNINIDNGTDGKALGSPLHSSRRKRNLSPQPECVEESSTSNKSPSTRMSKRSRGKEKILELPAIKEIENSETIPTASNNPPSLPTLENHSNGHTSELSISNKCVTKTSKRAFSETECDVPTVSTGCKKTKQESTSEVLDSDPPIIILVTSTTSSPADEQNNQKNVSTCVIESPKVIDIDIETNAERLLIESGLSDIQRREVLELLPTESKSLEDVEIVEQLVRLLLEGGSTLKSMSSPRFNKFLRSLLKIYCNSDSPVDKKHCLCESALNWAKERKTVNLKHELELSLMNLYYHTKFYRKAEQTATALYNATKKLQDKEKNVQACLCLSQTYHAMGNISKARANITTAKTEALKIYTAPDLQAELDLQSGIMQIAEEKDMETAFSYFKEAATGFTDTKKRSKSIKYMLLSKLLVNRPEEGQKAIQSQSHVKDIDEGVEALLCITKAAISCSLTDFTTTLTKYEKEFQEDLVVKDVIDNLYSKMLEKSLINIIQPYERMQISFVAEKIGLSRDEVERRLSQLILDGQLQAQLDHRDDCLYVYQNETKDSVYPSALQTISQLDRTLSVLNRRVKELL